MWATTFHLKERAPGCELGGARSWDFGQIIVHYCQIRRDRDRLPCRGHDRRGEEHRKLSLIELLRLDGTGPRHVESVMKRVNDIVPFPCAGELRGGNKQDDLRRLGVRLVKMKCDTGGFRFRGNDFSPFVE